MGSSTSPLLHLFHDLKKVLIELQFMMDFELKLEKPKVSRAWISAATMGAAYFIGISKALSVLPALPLDSTLIFPRRYHPNDPLFRY
jgi:hypothetical protein